MIANWIYPESKKDSEIIAGNFKYIECLQNSVHLLMKSVISTTTLIIDLNKSMKSKLDFEKKSDVV